MTEVLPQLSAMFGRIIHDHPCVPGTPSIGNAFLVRLGHLLSAFHRQMFAGVPRQMSLLKLMYFEMIGFVHIDLPIFEFWSTIYPLTLLSLGLRRFATLDVLRVDEARIAPARFIPYLRAI